MKMKQMSLELDREDVVREFNLYFQHPVDTEWTKETLEFRMKLLREEVKELEDAVKDIYESPYEGCEAAMLKEMADVQYVLSGMAVTLGLHLTEAFLRVHRSNLTKLGDDMLPIKRDDGKVLKGPNYKEPDLNDLVTKRHL